MAVNNFFPALEIQQPDIAGNFLSGMGAAQAMQTSQLQNTLARQEADQRAARIARDEQFRNLLAQSVGPMAANAAQMPGAAPGAQVPGAANYLMQGTQNALAPAPDQFGELLRLDPERAMNLQIAFEQQRAEQEQRVREGAAQGVRAAQFVLNSQDPKRTLEIGFPDMVEKLASQGVSMDDLDDDAVRGLANDVIAQLGPIAGVGPQAEGEGFTLSQGQKRFDRLGNVIASVAPEETDKDPNDKTFSRTTTLRKEYESRVEGFEAIRSAYENVQSAQPNDSGDTQLVLNFMRTISPGIRVQPGERIEDAASVPGIPSQVIGIWNKVAGGGKLNDGQRNEIRAQAKRTYETQRRLASDSRARYEGLARAAELDPTQVVGEPWAPVAEFNSAGVRSFDTAEQAEAAGLKPGTRVVINGVAGTWQ